MVLQRSPWGLGLILLFIMGLSLAGCGQKGPLYLPEESEMIKKIT